MSIDELGANELELYNRVLQLEGTLEEMANQVVNFGIAAEYKAIHRQYSELAKDDLEALKRGLFLMWYDLTEPTCFTGISELDPEAERQIVIVLNEKIENEDLDFELDWMLEFYSDFGFAFEQFSNYKHFYERTSRKTGIRLPESIDKESMVKRGQMGQYFLSVNFDNLNNYS